jgi:hypothetical protein
MQATKERVAEPTTDSWADINGRWFFAWRMATACEDALREVDGAIERQTDPDRALALAKVSSLLRSELLGWVRKGEALDMIVDHLPKSLSRQS